MSHRQPKGELRKQEDYFSTEWEIITKPMQHNPDWELDWSNIGLNWIDLDDNASQIYSIYLCILDKYIRILETVITTDKTFYIQLFSKCANEIAYRLLYKNSDKKNTNYRTSEYIDPKSFDGTSSFYEILVSYLTSCLKCEGELISVHKAAVDLVCTKCRTPHEVKSKNYKSQSIDLNTGAVRGINELIKNGFLIIIFKNDPSLYRVKDNSILAAKMTVTMPDSSLQSLFEFRNTLNENPHITYRKVKTKVLLELDDLEVIPLNKNNSERILMLKDNFDKKIIIAFADNLFNFEQEFIDKIKSKFGETITMEDETKFLLENVTLINQQNFIFKDDISGAIDKLFLNIIVELNIRNKQHSDDLSGIDRLSLQPKQGASANSFRSQLREEGARTSSFDTQQPGRGASASSAPVVKEGILKQYNPCTKRGIYEFDSKKITFDFDLKIPEIVKEKRVSGTFRPNGNLNNVRLLEGGRNIYINDSNLTTNYDNEEMYKNKYLKYKNKYIQLKLNIK